MEDIEIDLEVEAGSAIFSVSIVSVVGGSMTRICGSRGLGHPASLFCASGLVRSFAKFSRCILRRWHMYELPIPWLFLSGYFGMSSGYDGATYSTVERMQHCIIVRIVASSLWSSYLANEVYECSVSNAKDSNLRLHRPRVRTLHASLRWGVRTCGVGQWGAELRD